MKLYSIGELEVLSQIKSHTIRIWEQRYNLLTPTRSDGNTRYYSEEQLMKLLKVALVNKSGMKISAIAKLSDIDLDNKANEVAFEDKSIEIAVEQLMVASLHFNQKKIAELFNNYNAQYGVEDTFEKIIFPYLRVVGNLWVNGKITPGHEHFFSNLCKLKLFSEIDKLPLPETNKASILLCQPEWDFHELGILYYYFLFRKAGYNCTYLGQAVPVIDIKQAAHTIKAAFIISTFIGPTVPEKIVNFVEDILENTTVELLISGPHVNFPIDNYNGRLTVFYNMDVLIEKFNLKAVKE